MSEVKVNKISPRTNCGTTQLGDAGDTITVTGDLKSNSLKSASGSTITLGQSGDTIQLGCGASQTGFGRTGTVDWDTTPKTASFTAVSGNGYFVNTTSGAITVTLPATPSAGDIVAVSDYAGTALTNNITIARNGSNIEGTTENGVINNNRDSITLVYVDGTQGWLAVNDNESSFIAPAFVTATGGTETTCGDYKIHTFTGPGTFCVSSVGNPIGSTTVDYLVIAGGGGGGSDYAGGAGAGGYRESSGAASGCYTTSPLGACVSALPVTATGYPITVGSGGAGATGSCGCRGSSGNTSTFSTISSAGGGGGGGEGSCSTGGSGGSGGGSSYSGGAGLGNTPPVSPPQGNNGGSAVTAGPGYAGSGGGGAGAVGGNGSPTVGGSGGNGVTTSINATPTTRAGGGGGAGGGPSVAQPYSPGPGGSGGGGAGAPSSSSPGGNGSTNTGSGGGGGNESGGNGGSGGSGIVIIRYKYQ
jgi:hypothetical protein